VKDAFAKKFLVSGEIPLAARSHRFFGNILLKAGHLMRSGVVVSGTVLRGGQELATSIQNELVLLCVFKGLAVSHLR
jgi:hypothetical protein